MSHANDEVVWAGSTPWLLEEGAGRQLILLYAEPVGAHIDARFDGTEVVETERSVTIAVRQTIKASGEATWFGRPKVIVVELAAPLAGRSLRHAPVSEDLRAFTPVPQD